MKRLGPDVWDDENEEPIRKIGDQTLIEDEKLNELQRMVDEGNVRFKDDGSRYTLPDAETMGILNRLTKVNSEPEVKRVETIKKIAQQDRPVLRQKIADKFVNSIKQGAEAGYTSSKTYGSPETAQATISNDGFSDKSNEALRNSFLGLGAAGAAVGLGKAYGFPNYLGSAADRISDKGTIQLPMRRNATDFQYLNSKAQPIVESPFYKQGIPDEILQNRLGVVPETKIPLQTKQQLPVDRVNPEQIKYNQLQESLKNSPTRGASFSGSPAEYSNVVGKPQLAKEMESKLAKDYFAKQILRGLPPVIENNPTNVFNSKSVGVNDNIDFWNNKTDDVVGHSPIDTSNLKERVNAAMSNNRFKQSFDEAKNYRNYVKTLAGNTEGNPTVDMFYQGSPLSQTEVAGEVLSNIPKAKPINTLKMTPYEQSVVDQLKLIPPETPEVPYRTIPKESGNIIEEIIAENQLKGLEKGLPRRPLRSTMTGRMTKSLPEVGNIFEKGASKLGGKAALGALASAALFSNPSMAAQEMISSEGVGHSNELDAIKLMKITGMGYDEALNALAMEKAELEKEQQLQYQKEAIKAIISDKFKNNLQY